MIWYQEIVDLGISSRFIPKDLTEETYQELYLKIKRYNKYYTVRLIIDKPWQLAVLSGSEPLNDVKLGESLDNCGLSALHYAAWSGNKETLRLALEKARAHLWDKDNHGWTFLHHAACSGNKETLSFALEKAGAHLWDKDNHGATFLHHAARSGNKETLSFALEKAGANLWDKDNDGATFLHYAAWSGNKETLSFALEKAGAHLWDKDNHGWTFLHDAARSGSKETLALALEVLKSNYVITKIKTPPDCDNPTKTVITEVIARNKCIVSIDTQIKKLIADSKGWLATKKSSEIALQKVAALRELKQMFDNRPCSFTQDSFKQWYSSHATTINAQHKWINLFSLSIRTLVSRLSQAFRFDEEMVIALPAPGLEVQKLEKRIAELEVELAEAKKEAERLKVARVEEALPVEAKKEAERPKVACTVEASPVVIGISAVSAPVDERVASTGGSYPAINALLNGAPIPLNVSVTRDDVSEVRKGVVVDELVNLNGVHVNQVPEFFKQIFSPPTEATAPTYLDLFPSVPKTRVPSATLAHVRAQVAV